MLKKKKVERLILLDFKTYYKIIVIKGVWYWQNNRQIKKWNRTENSEIDSHKRVN